MFGMVGVGGNNEARAFGLCRADMIRAQIETLRTRMALEPHTATNGGGDNPVEIETEGLAMQQQTSRGMAERFQMRAFERPQQPVSHLLRLLIHMAMYA